VPLNTRNKC